MFAIYNKTKEGIWVGLLWLACFPSDIWKGQKFRKACARGWVIAEIPPLEKR